MGDECLDEIIILKWIVRCELNWFASWYGPEADSGGTEWLSLTLSKRRGISSKQLLASKGAHPSMELHVNQCLNYESRDPNIIQRNVWYWHKNFHTILRQFTRIFLGPLFKIARNWKLKHLETSHHRYVTLFRCQVDRRALTWMSSPLLL